jgi:3D (Asp-Asp-Asp) domain-containing protein
MRENLIAAVSEKPLFIRLILAITSVILCFLFLPYAILVEADNNTNTKTDRIKTNANFPKSMILVQENSVLSQSDHETKTTEKIKAIPKRKMRVLATAYSSTVDQCDSSPFITANGTHVHDGTLAANFLKFGTKVKFPSLYGDKIFIVEDRMKSDYKVDLWFPTRQEAKNFGAKWIEMEIL